MSPGVPLQCGKAQPGRLPGPRNEPRVKHPLPVLPVNPVRHSTRQFFSSLSAFQAALVSGESGRLHIWQDLVTAGRVTCQRRDMRVLLSANHGCWLDVTGFSHPSGLQHQLPLANCAGELTGWIHPWPAYEGLLPTKTLDLIAKPCHQSQES